MWAEELDPRMCDRAADWLGIDTAPLSGGPLLVFHSAWDSAQVGIYDQATDSWQVPTGDLIRRPEYWMPLPSGPEPQRPEL